VPYFAVDGVALFYEVRGDGNPIVLLHGFTSSFSDNWERRGWVDLLTDQGFRVVGPDFPSHGESERLYEPRACTTARLASDVVALLDHLMIDRADVCGFSMGAGVALQLAMDYPKRVRRVVVTGIGDAALNRLHDPHTIAEILAAFEADPAEGVVLTTAQRIRRSAELRGNDLRALAAFLRTGGWPGGLPAQRPVRAPVLLVVAESDQYMTPADELARWLRHAEVFRVAGADHYTVLDDEGARARVLRFLSEPSG
jgi:pimeloyl-ACP methyl ester carboxylesterase